MNLTNGLPDPIPRKIEVIDSHTGGEPTRIVISGWPQPPGATMRQRRDYLLRHHDRLRAAVVCEPRGHSAVVGGLLTPPIESDSMSGVVFFNDVGYLGMCGHGLIGLVETLRFMGKISKGTVRIDTPVGTVSADLEEDGRVTISNVPSYLYRKDISLDVPELGAIEGDIAYGGNWFFLVKNPMGELSLANLDSLMTSAKAIRRALAEAEIRGPRQEVIDHIEYYGHPTISGADSKNFVLCPGNAYDRSCCGTGTSAKMAGLFSRGKLKPGEVWTQESITGSIFEGWVEKKGDRIIPFIRSRAHVVSQAVLFFNPEDEFCWGIE
jgi:4-hydroxyproline epimerase